MLQSANVSPVYPSAHVLAVWLSFLTEGQDNRKLLSGK